MGNDEPKKVGRARYIIGLVMFITPLAFAWASPYFGRHVPGYTAHPVIFAVSGDFLLLLSLFLLGGEFWELRALFLHDAPAATSTHVVTKAGKESGSA